MRKTGSRRFGAIAILALALIIVCSVGTLSACNNEEGTVRELSVVEDTLKDYYVVGEFDITSVMLNVTYEDDTVNPISVSKSMITTEDAASLKEAGEKNITVKYRGKSVVLTFTLVEDGAQIVCVTFHDKAGNDIAKKYALVGGTIEAPAAPEIEGQRFEKWVDAKGNAAVLTDVKNSVDCYPSYSNLNESCTVNFYDFDGSVVSSASGSSKVGTVIKNGPSLDTKKHPEVMSYTWSVGFPYTVSKSVDIYPVVKYNTCAVFFSYSYESAPGNTQTIESCSTSVIYGESVSEQAKRMESELAKLGLEIVTKPNVPAKVEKVGSLQLNYIVRDASVAIKVYQDQDKKQQITGFPSPAKIGSSIDLPDSNSALTVSGMVFRGWKITGSSGSVEVTDRTWTVTKDYGLSVEITPFYTMATVPTSFEFCFNTLSGNNYSIILAINDKFSAEDVVTYQYIDNLLQNIIDNANDYVTILGGRTVSSTKLETKNVTEGGVTSLRNEVLQDEIEYYGIIKVEYNEENTLEIDKSAPIGGSGISVVVTLARYTTGLVFEAETDGTGYAVTGLDATYVNGTHIFIPSTYNEKPVVRIGNNAFNGKYISKLSENLTVIGKEAFKGATLYGNIDLTKLTALGESAFENASVIADTVTFGVLTGMEGSAFNGTKFYSITDDADVTVNLGNLIIEVPANAFKDASGLSSVVLPETVQKVSDYAFCGTGIKSITSLVGVKAVGEHAFDGTALTSLTLPAVTSIDDAAFVNMTELTTLTLSNMAEDAEEDSVGFTFFIDALAGSVNIGQLNIGNGVQAISISDAALFATFTKLTAINVAHNSNMFSHEGVLYVKYTVEGDTFYALGYYPNAKTGNYKPVVPEGGTVVIAPAAFANATVVVLDLSEVDFVIADDGIAENVYAVVIGAKTDEEGAVVTDEDGRPVCDETVKAMAVAAFPNAGVVAVSEQSAYGYLESEQLVYELVTVGEGDNMVTTVSIIAGSANAVAITVPAKIDNKDVTSIKNGAFAGYTELKTLTVQATLNGWNNTILNGCTALTDFTVKAWSRGYTPALGDFSGNAWYDAHNVIVVGGVPVGYNNNAGKTTVSAEEAAAYFAGGVIPENFFEGANITSISLPASIKTLEKEAFKGSALEDFTAVGLTYVGSFVFEKCVYLSDITLNFVGTQSVMYEGVFFGCTGLSSVTFIGEVNASVEAGISYYSLAAQTFNGCTSLTDVNLGKINNLREQAFFGCHAITEFDFSTIIGREIPAHAFGYTGIKYAILTSDKLTTIGQEAFAHCPALEYVQLGSTVVNIGVNAFDNVNPKFVAELAYSTGGLYNSTAKVDGSAFNANATFFISQMVYIDEIDFLRGRDAEKIKNTYPRLSFSVTNDTSTELQFSMSDIANQILFVESDLIAPTFAGYSFAGWYEKVQGDGSPIVFPYIVRQDVTVYAKYYNEKQGSVKAETDVKYVYYISAAPEIELDAGESVVWSYIKNGEAEKHIASFPFIMEASSGDNFVLKGSVYKGAEFVYSRLFEDCGTLGYALVKYSGSNASTMIIPDSYDDGVNGLDEFVVIFAGAFNTTMSSEFVIPLGVKAIYAGAGEVSKPIDEFDDTTSTFKTDLKRVVIPAGVEYIADGVFTGANIEDIRFVEGSNLLYATENAFKGSAWWAKQIENARTTNGFVVAGRLAVKFIGTAKVFMINSEDDKVFVTTNKSGFAETTGVITVNVRIYDENYDYTDNIVTVSADAEMANGKVYKYVINSITGVELTFVINSDNTGWSYAAGKNILFVQSVPTGTTAVALGVVDKTATIPGGVIKVNDGIFRGMKNIETVTLNKELEIIGDEAFKNSGLTTLRYGTNDNEQYVSAIDTIGKDAFEGTALYKKEKVIIGTIFLKYNHLNNSVISINESVVKIAAGAFRGINNLNSVNIGSTTLREIGAYAFKNCNIKAVTVPGSLAKMGRGAFENCAALITLDLSKTALTEIPDNAFNGDKELTSLSLPASVTQIGKGALSGCVALTTITAAGISHLDVAGDSFASGLGDTKWYNPTIATGSAATDDVVLMLGTVLVKYIVGTKAKSVYEKDGAYTVTVANGVTEIAFNAFYGITQYITDVVLPNSVKEIGAYAFANTGIKTVKFGSGLEVIRDHAFYNSVALKTATLPNGLKEIDDYAFAGTSLTTEICNAKGERVEDQGYTIPDSVTRVGERAFSGVNTLTIINLGISLVDIGMGAFDTAFGNTTSNFYKVNWNLTIDKTATNESGDPIPPIAILQNNIAANDDGAHNYGKSLFKTSADKDIRFYATEAVCAYIEANYMGLWISSGEDEGYGWEFYTNGTLPSVTPENDGYSVPVITTEYIKEGDLVTPLHSTVSGSTYTFMYWGLVNEDDGTTTPIVYPYLVTKDMRIRAVFYENEVEGNAVAGESNKITGTDSNEAIFVAATSNNTNSGQTASITSITTDKEELYVPNRINGVRITSFDVTNDTVKKLVITYAENFNGMTENKFSGFTALESIEIYNAGYNSVDFKVVPVELSATYVANGVNKTHKDTFYVLYSNDTAAGSNYGSKLIAVIGNVKAATERARAEGYEGTADLEFMFEVPEGVTEIYQHAFINSGITKVTLPSTLTVIGDEAFGVALKELRVSNKINLTNVTKNAIDEHAPIWENAVAETANGYITLKGLQYTTAYGSFYAIANVLVGYNSNITEYLGSDGFTLPTTVNGINITVIASKMNLTASKINIKTLILPTNLERINNDAFNSMNFQNVLNADNYANLTYIADNVFNETAYYDGSGALYVGKVLVRWQNASGDVAIKSDTVAIAASAMKGANITRIEIPGKVVSIGESAFFACPQLREVIIPNSVTTIGDRAFGRCISLSSVTINTVDSMLYSIGQDAFTGDTALVGINLPYSLYKLGASAFSGCTALKTVTFDGFKGDDTIDETKLSNLNEIGKEAFNGASGLEEIKIPKNVKVIRSKTFENCTGLVNIDFENGSVLETIEDSAFQNCYKLGSKLDPENLDLYTVNLPDSLVTVGSSAFYGCRGMWGITFGCNIDSLGPQVFTGCLNLVKVEIRRATAPTITSTTFVTGIESDGEETLANYRLRVYVQADYNDKVIINYKSAWENAWSDCASHIYNRVTKPTLTLVPGNGAQSQTLVGDVFLSNRLNGISFNGASYSDWIYAEFNMNTTIDTTKDYSANRLDKSYKNATQFIGGEGAEQLYILIVDYDNIVMNSSGMMS